MATPIHPFAVSELSNVPLREAPLVRAIGQVRFPGLTRFTVDGDAVAAAIAAELVQQYPLMRVGHEVAEILTSEGVSEESRPTRVWRLTSADELWRVTFSASFLSVDTSRYLHRDDFVEHLVEAWTALSNHVDVPFIERIGVRYVNQLTDNNRIERITELIRAEVLGVAVAPQPDGAELLSSLTEARYAFAGGAFFASRWGLLPPCAAVDQELEVFDYPTWVLDMDSFQEFAPNEYAGADLRELVLRLALRGYQFFRWTVTEEGLKEFGGDHGI